MGIEDSGLLVAKFGAFFTAAHLTNPMTAGKVTAFTLEGAPPVDWTHWGHLSRENLPTPEADGGDSSTLSTWLRSNTTVEYEEATNSITINLNQVDADTLDALHDLDGTSLAGFLLVASGGKRWGQWIPSAKVQITQAPTPAVDGYFETQIRLSIQKPPTSLNLDALRDPENGIARFKDWLYFDDRAFVAA